jgi:two-component system sensor histidine kinase VicK
VLKHSRAKSKFIDYLSHEMRNSLNVISASAEHYLDTKSGDMPRESVEDIRTAVEQSTRIVSDVLTLEKMECGKLELEREAYGVRGMVARTARAFSKDVARRGLRLEIEHPPEGAAAQVVGDEHRAAQILSNFLSNAVKFTRSEVRVSWRVEEGRYSGGAALAVRVEDDGPGIDERDLPLLFQSFTQLRAGKMQGGGGSGLGLAICKEVRAARPKRGGGGEQPGAQRSERGPVCGGRRASEGGRRGRERSECEGGAPPRRKRAGLPERAREASAKKGRPPSAAETGSLGEREGGALLLRKQARSASAKEVLPRGGSGLHRSGETPRP